MRELRIATFNIHKGVTSFNARLVLHEQRELIRNLRADIVFLQEVRGAHRPHQRRFAHWPTESQHEFLADSIWREHAYGKNSIYPAGHHGNALLSKFPIVRWENIDISAHAAEQRGMLHCEVAVSDWDQPLHCICVHLGLFARWRHQQLAWLKERIESVVPPSAPLIIAGDFNDWRMKAGQTFAADLHLREVFELGHGRPARSFPSVFPLLCLDRIYVRGFQVHHAQIHGGAAFSRVSDHVALSATLLPL
ncbi:MAG: endonuclease/exonuclease/phosphatase family protein [Methylobacillus sp.]|jgi:endonuclease/exonuclease/phosphatase family metal-dependent hydrolase|nr:endonuclease/exonuclease/phosphatase family protein [Methylobacillus sp.]